MVKSFEIAAINKTAVEGEAYKRFKDRGYSKRTLKNYCPNIKKAKFLRKEKGFSIYRIPVKKGSCPKDIKKEFRF